MIGITPSEALPVDTDKGMADSDLIVIGAGSAGLVAASTAARLGAKVILIESDRVGGDCTWTGCIPSKALIHAAEVASESGGKTGTAATGVDGRAVMERVRVAIASVYQRETPEKLAKIGVQVLAGSARFRDPVTVEVSGSRLTAPRIVISTGAAPGVPPVPGLEEAGYLTHRNIFDLERLPPRLIVLGGGAIGVELAQAISRLGSEVSLVEQSDRLLPTADPDASRLIAGVLAAEGVDLHLGSAVEQVRRRGATVQVQVAGRQLEADALLVATGRRPLTEGLEPGRAGVLLDHGAIRVDHRLRTSVSGIYAAGDVTGGLQFTHYAGWQGYAAARNALFPGSVRGVRDGLPWAVFSDPAVAQVGQTLAEAMTRHPNAVEHRIGLDRVDRADTEAATVGFVKLISDRGDRLLGACVVSPRADELINELSLAIQLKATMSDLSRTIHVYPSYGLAIQDLAAAQRLARASSGWRGRVAGWFVDRLR